MTIKNRLGFRAAQYVLAAGIGSGALAIAPAPALAEGSDSRMLTLLAEVPALCTMTEFTASTLSIDVAGGLPSTSTLSTETTVNCNIPSQVRLTSTWGGIVETSVAMDSSPVMTNFASRFDYVAAVKAGGTTFATLDTAADPAFLVEETTGLQPAFDAATTTADMALTVEITPALSAGGQALMAGTFSDQLQLEILPQN